MRFHLHGLSLAVARPLHRVVRRERGQQGTGWRRNVRPPPVVLPRRRGASLMAIRLDKALRCVLVAVRHVETMCIVPTRTARDFDVPTAATQKEGVRCLQQGAPDASAARPVSHHQRGNPTPFPVLMKWDRDIEDDQPENVALLDADQDAVLLRRVILLESPLQEGRCGIIPQLGN